MTNIPFFRHKNQKNGENFDFLKYICYICRDKNTITHETEPFPDSAFKTSICKSLYISGLQSKR